MLHYAPCSVQTASPRVLGWGSLQIPTANPARAATPLRAGLLERSLMSGCRVAIKHSQPVCSSFKRRCWSPFSWSGVAPLPPPSSAPTWLSGTWGATCSGHFPSLSGSTGQACWTSAGHLQDITYQPQLNQNKQMNCQVPNFESQCHLFLHYLKIFFPDNQKPVFFLTKTNSSETSLIKNFRNSQLFQS